MMNRTTLACSALAICAMLLSGLLVMNLSAHSSVAQAGMTSNKGDFTVLTTRTRAGSESLFVIDNQADMLVVYDVELRGRGGRMEPFVKENLGKLFSFGRAAGETSAPTERERQAR